mgnify:CR=1 FL=1
MTQQNQRKSLLEQAQLTYAERHKIWLDLGVSKTPARDAWSKLRILQDESADAATRKAFEVIIARAREIGNSDVRGFADALEAQIRSEEAHDA